MRRIAQLTVRLMGPDEETEETQEVVDQFNSTVNSFETDMSAELPEGYYVKADD